MPRTRIKAPPMIAEVVLSIDMSRPIVELLYDLGDLNALMIRAKERKCRVEERSELDWRRIVIKINNRDVLIDTLYDCMPTLQHVTIYRPGLEAYIRDEFKKITIIDGSTGRKLK